MKFQTPVQMMTDASNDTKCNYTVRLIRTMAGSPLQMRFGHGQWTLPVYLHGYIRFIDCTAHMHHSFDNEEIDGLTD